MNDVHPVLDGPRLGAVADAEKPLAVVGAARDAQDVGAGARGGAHELGKLDVVADGHGQPAEGGLEHIDAHAAADVPVALEPRHVQFGLDAVPAARTSPSVSSWSVEFGKDDQACPIIGRRLHQAHALIAKLLEGGVLSRGPMRPRAVEMA